MIRENLRICVLAFVFIPASVSQVNADDQPWAGRAFSANAEVMVKAAEKIPVPEHAEVEYLIDEAFIRIEADGRTTEHLHQVYRVLTEPGIEANSQLSAIWSPWYQKRPKMSARVINGNREETHLIEREISEGPVEAHDNVYNDQRRLQAPLPAIQVGSIVETLIVLEDSEPFLRAGVLDYRIFNRPDVTRMVRLTLDVPDAQPLQFKQYGPRLKLTEIRRNGRHVRTWTTNEWLSFVGYELTAPADAIQGTQVAFSTARSWGDVANAYRGLVEGKLKNVRLQNQVKQLVNNERDPMTKVEKLVDFVQQQVRYTGLSLGDGSIVPTHPDETLRRRYGDCKDQSVLLIAMLRLAGIDAHPVLLRSSLGRDIIPEFPGIAMFNHMIVYVAGPKEMWIDPTATTVPLGQLPLSVQNRHCLVIRAGETSLRRSPGSTAADNGQTRVREIVIDEFGKSTLTETTTYRGSTASDLRSLILIAGDREFKAGMIERTKERLATSTIRDVKWTSVRDLKTPFEITLTCEGSRLIECSTKEGQIAIVPSSILYGLPEELLDTRPYLSAEDEAIIAQDPNSSEANTLLEEKQRKRKQNLPIHDPQSIELVNRIHWPVGFRAVDVPPNHRKEIGSGFIELVYSAEPGKPVTATYRMNTGSAALTPDQIQEWQAEIEELFGPDSAEWVVSLHARHESFENIAQQDVREGLKILKRQHLEQPENLACRLRLAEAYSECGFIEAARDLMLQTTKANPNSSEAFRAAGALFSKPVYPGARLTRNELQQAIMLLRRGLELDPDNADIRSSLAILLRVDGNGALAEEELLRESATLLQSDVDSLTKEGHWLLVQTLYFAEEHEKLLEHLRKYPDIESAIIFRAASTCILKGPKEALALVRKEVPRDDQYVTVREVQQALVLVRHYDVALRLLNAAEIPMAANEEVESVKERLKHLRHYEDTLEPASEPKGLAQRLVINALTQRDLAGDSEAMIHHGADRHADILAEIRRVFFPQSEDEATTARSSRQIADAVSLLNFTVEQLDDVSYSVKVSEGFMSEVRFYMTRIDNKLTVLTIDSFSKHIAMDALEMLKDGDAESAKKLLTWISIEAGDIPRRSNAYLGSPFAHLWNSRSELVEADRIQLAAIALSDPAEIDDPMPFLLEMREKCDPDDQIQIDRVMVNVLLQKKNWADGLPVVERLVKNAQGRREYWRIKTTMLSGDKQYQQAAEWLQSQLELEPGNSSIHRMLATLEFEQGRIEKTVELMRTAAKGPHGSSLEYNLAAWASLFLESVDEQVYDDARNAVQLSAYHSVASMNTLAAVCVELGRIEEAQVLLEKCIQERPGHQPTADDFYISGRIAEYLELPDVAQFYYDKVISLDTSSRADSIAALAQKRRGNVMKTVSFQSQSATKN